MTQPDLVQRRVVVSGRVQGVFFRQTTRDLARQHGLRGWVLNRPDGRVEAVFQGPAAAVERMIGWCHDGPPGAAVTSVEVREEQPAESFPGFAIRRSGLAGG